MAKAPPIDTAKEKSSSMGMGMWGAIKLVHTKFPKVKDITTDTLHSWLEPEMTKNIILMDCRDQSEYAVSHLAGAQIVDNYENVDPQQLLCSLPQDKASTVVCYCSVGYRSAILAEKLQKYMSGKEAVQNVEAVYNLQGSLFKWANEGRPMVNPAGQPTKLCHPYNAVWGKILNKELRCSGGISVD